MTDADVRKARIFGAVLQGSIMGIFLFFAILKLIESSAVGFVFRYQGF